MEKFKAFFNRVKVYLVLLLFGIFIIFATFYAVFSILAIIAIIVSAIVKIPTAHYGVETFFGKRTGRKFKEGLHLKIPFFGEVLLYPMSLQTYNLSGSESIVVTSADKLKIEIEGSVQLRPDFNNISKFVEIPEETIKVGMRDAIEGGLGIIAGQENGESFVEKREAIWYIINCLFQLERRPDFYVEKDESTDKLTIDRPSFHDYLDNLNLVIRKEDEVNQKKIKKLAVAEWKISKKRDEEGKEVEVLSVLDFYNQNVTRIETMLQLEKLAEVISSSPIEELYAIEIAAFKLAKVTFSKEITEAFEKEKKAEKELRATERRQKIKLEIMNALIAKGVPAAQASNDADAAVGIAPKQTIAGNAIPILNIGGKNA